MLAVPFADFDGNLDIASHQYRVPVD